MSEEIEKISVQEQFEELLAANDDSGIKEFLNEQNISDVADLIDENENRQGGTVLAYERVEDCCSVA